MTPSSDPQIADAARRDRLIDIALGLGLLPILMLALFLFLGIVEPKFFSADNLVNVLRNASFLMLVAAGQMMVLIIGGFDLSVGAVIALSSVASAITMSGLFETSPDLPLLAVLVGVAAGLAAGAAIGLLNGLIVAYMKVSPFMVTLGTLSIASGLAFYITAGVPVYGMPDLFTRDFGRLRFAGLPVAIFVTFAALIVIWWIMNWTRFGRYVYAIGGNIHAARVSGVSTVFYIVLTYVSCSFLAAVTGVLLTARVGSGEAALGGSLMLQSIAAAVIGGVSLRGGVGRIEMVAMGALFLAVVTNAMNLLRVDSKLQTMVIGVVIIAAVAAESLKPKGQSR